MKPLKIMSIIFLLSFTGHAFGKSNVYYKATLVHVLSNCNSDCQKKVFEQEVHKAFFVLIETMLNQIRFELSMKEKELYD